MKVGDSPGVEEVGFVAAVVVLDDRLVPDRIAARAWFKTRVEARAWSLRQQPLTAGRFRFSIGVHLAGVRQSCADRELLDRLREAA